MTVIADAVREFEPDHILIALHASDHANWQDAGSSSTSRTALACRSPHSRSTSPDTLAPPTARCCSATTDPRMPSTRSARRPPARRSRCAGRDRLAADARAGQLRIRRRDRQHVRLRRSQSRRRRPRWARRPRRRSHRATGRPSRRAGRRRGDRTGVEDDRRDRRPPRRRHDRHGLPRTDRSAVDAAGSVSNAIVHHADRPTLVIRQSTQRAVRSSH